MVRHMALIAIAKILFGRGEILERFGDEDGIGVTLLKVWADWAYECVGFRQSLAVRAFALY